jgi:lipopolysaccharide transport system ATP-binding protein
LAVIRVENLGKRYRLGLTHAGSVRELVNRATARLLGRQPPPLPHEAQPTSKDGHFWALRDVSFEVQPGEVLGIIGRNGAGKSTLLKILSRITAPTQGRARIFGRVASLLEVGTGFHPELSGRENIFLNGAILGMTRAEVRRKFDEIVAFAEVEPFIDTPVKRYSSGMYVRLAFAVAAHLEPEVLIVDEVLAVGDVGFQKKCLGKMSEVSRQGRTVLFVSHNMQAVTQLTEKSFLLEAGRISYQGPSAEAVRRFLANGRAELDAGPCYLASKGKQGHFLRRAAVHTSEPGGEHRWGQPIQFEFEFQLDEPRDGLCFSFQIIDETERPMTHFWLLDRTDLFRAGGQLRIACNVAQFRLYMGSYSLKTFLADRRSNELVETLSGICPFEVSMQGVHRDQYDWQPGAAVYLEDCRWEVGRAGQGNGIGVRA